MERDLSEGPAFVRDNLSLGLVRKILSRGEESLASLVSPRNPFGLGSNFRARDKGDLVLYASGGDGFARTEDLPKGRELAGSWKILLSKAAFEHAGRPFSDGKRRVFSRLEVMPPGSASTDSYLVIGPFRSQAQARNARSYLATKFCRFLVAAILITQNMTRDKFRLVPLQDFGRAWTDKKLYRAYGLDPEDIDLIESSIRPMKAAYRGAA
jgi:site-specific DNA-methyltransferase (adenine-specific)